MTEITVDVITDGPYDSLVISGLGLRIISIYGLLEYYKSKINTKAIYCTSGGCIPGLAFLLGYSFDQYTRLLDRMSDLFQEITTMNIDRIWDLLKYGSLVNTEGIKAIFMLLLRGKQLDENITLNELFKKTGIRFSINVINANTEEIEVVSYLTYPDKRVVDACINCISVPFLYVSKSDLVDAGFDKFSMYDVSIEDGYNPIICHIFHNKRKHRINTATQSLTTLIRQRTINAETIKPTKGLLLKIRQPNVTTITHEYICQRIQELTQYLDKQKKS